MNYFQALNLIERLANENNFKAFSLKLIMAKEEDYSNISANETGYQIKDIEEKQKILKDRMLLIGQNLIELKEITSEKILELKKEIEELKRTNEKTKAFIENISREFSRLARKDELEIIAKQLKMFQPLQYIKEQKIKTEQTQ